MNLKTIISIFLFLMTVESFANFTDTALVLKNLKLRLLSDFNLGLLRESTLDAFCKQDLKATLLNNKGFQNFLFFKIEGQVLAIDSSEDKKHRLIYQTPICLKEKEDCFLIVAFNSINGQFYRIKGAHQNDFYDLYSSLSDWRYWKKPALINNSTIKHFIKNFEVENIDFQCLLRSIKTKKGDCLEYFSPPLITH